MRCQRSVPDNDSQLLEKAVRYYDAIKNSPLIDSVAAKALVENLGQLAGNFKVGCEEARFFDRLKVEAKNQIKKELKATLKRVIHYMEAMASDDVLKELQKAGVELVKPKTRKKKSTKVEQQEAAPTPAAT